MGCNIEFIVNVQSIIYVLKLHFKFFQQKKTGTFLPCLLFSIFSSCFPYTQTYVPPLLRYGCTASDLILFRSWLIRHMITFPASSTSSVRSHYSSVLFKRIQSGCLAIYTKVSISQESSELPVHRHLLFRKTHFRKRHVHRYISFFLYD